MLRPQRNNKPSYILFLYCSLRIYTHTKKGKIKQSQHQQAYKGSRSESPKSVLSTRWFKKKKTYHTFASVCNFYPYMTFFRRACIAFYHKWSSNNQMSPFPINKSYIFPLSERVWTELDRSNFNQVHRLCQCCDSTTVMSSFDGHLEPWTVFLSAPRLPLCGWACGCFYAWLLPRVPI